MLKTIVRTGRQLLKEWRLPTLSKSERRRDHETPFEPDPGIDAAVKGALDWLRRAQDRSATHDGGVAHSFSVLDGWAASYPETTGYIIPTFLKCADRFGDADLRERARRMLDWCVSIQFPEGGFQGGTVNATPKVPVTFNTGQILIGLASGVRVFGDGYAPAMRKAASWLATTQDDDGCWRKFRTPFAKPSDKAYETHVAWGLYEAARIEPNASWVAAANRQLHWALSRQQKNGWFADNCLSDPERPLTHTIGYVLRGTIEAHLFTGDPLFLAAAIRTADGLLGAIDGNGRLPGRLNAGWRGEVDWVCLTGTVQIAHCWLQLYQLTGDPRYCEAAFRGNAFVRRTVRSTGDPGVVGGVKGSLPINGGYATYLLPNWASKFFIDANLLEADVRHGTTA